MSPGPATDRLATKLCDFLWHMDKDTLVLRSLRSWSILNTLLDDPDLIEALRERKRLPCP